MDIKTAKNIYCVGIGGIGLSGLARLLHWQGKRVTGSDLSRSQVTDGLKKLGLAVELGQAQAKHVPKDTQIVIRSLAVPQNHPELLAAKKIKASILTYPEALGQIMEDKKLIAVAGTHGKTTTTALIGEIFIKAGLDPTIIVGSLVPSLDGNARLGKSDYYVVEADEYGKAFLNYNPFITVITTIDADHLDIYKDINDIIDTFKIFISQTDKNGLIIANADDPATERVIIHNQAKVVNYGFNSGDYRAEKVNLGKTSRFFEKQIGEVTIKLIGRHNVANALAAIACAHQLGIESDIIKKSLKHFKGTWRRFEKIGVFQGADVISDYAHHPTEIAATLEAAKVAYRGKKIITVFQPHSHQRTKKLFNEFVKSFDSADQVIISETYDVAGREDKKWGIDSLQMSQSIKLSKKDTYYAKKFSEVKNRLKELADGKSLIIIMGAGSIDQVARDLVVTKKI